MNNNGESLTQSPAWAVNIIHTCVAVQPGEKVFIVVDEPLSYVREALLRESLQARPSELWSFTFPNALRPFVEYPTPVLTIATQMDVVILLLASLDAEKEVPAWVAGREVIRKGKARFNAGAYIDQSVLDHELS